MKFILKKKKKFQKHHTQGIKTAVKFHQIIRAMNELFSAKSEYFFFLYNSNEFFLAKSKKFSWRKFAKKAAKMVLLFKKKPIGAFLRIYDFEAQKNSKLAKFLLNV